MEEHALKLVEVVVLVIESQLQFFEEESILVHHGLLVELVFVISHINDNFVMQRVQLESCGEHMIPRPDGPHATPYASQQNGATTHPLRAGSSAPATGLPAPGNSLKFNSESLLSLHEKAAGFGPDNPFTLSSAL